MQTPTIFTRILTCLFAVCALLLPVTAAEDQRPAKPNVVLMFVDDLGWQDVKCYDIGQERCSVLEWLLPCTYLCPISLRTAQWRSPGKGSENPRRWWSSTTSAPRYRHDGHVPMV